MFKRVLMVTVAAGLVAACADRWNVEEVRTMQVQGDKFAEALHREYVDLAASERAESDWGDAAFFLEKAQAAARGEQVGPQMVAERDLSAKDAAAAAQARDALMAKLNGPARTMAPQIAARAQAGGFDCWLQELEEGHQPAHIAACRDTFDKAMAALDVTPPKAEPAPQPAAEAGGPFVVFFAMASSTLDANAKAVLSKVADAYQADKPATVVIAGHTDTVGDAQTNIRLSQKRAENVAEALASMGVAATSMALEAYGEEQLSVATADATAEPKNRRVEIRFQDEGR